MQWSQKKIEKAELDASMCIRQGTLSFFNSNCWISDNNKNNSNSFLENPETGSGEEKLLKRDFYVTGWLMNFLIFTQKREENTENPLFISTQSFSERLSEKKVNVKHLCWLAQNPAHIKFQGIRR